MQKTTTTRIKIWRIKPLMFTFLRVAFTYPMLLCTDLQTHMQGLLIGSNLGSKTWRHLDKSSQGTNHPVINGQPALPPELQPVAASPLLIFVIYPLLSFILFWQHGRYLYGMPRKHRNWEEGRGDSGTVRVTTWLTNRRDKVSFVWQRERGGEGKRSRVSSPTINWHMCGKTQ